MFVRVNAKIVNGGQTREVWFVFETDHESMKDLHAAMVKDGSICGTRYETRPEGGRRVVKDAFEAIVMADTITSIMDLAEDLYDDDGAALWLLTSGEVAKWKAAQ